MSVSDMAAVTDETLVERFVTLSLSLPFEAPDDGPVSRRRWRDRVTALSPLRIALLRRGPTALELVLARLDDAPPIVRLDIVQHFAEVAPRRCTAVMRDLFRLPGEVGLMASLWLSLTDREWLEAESARLDFFRPSVGPPIATVQDLAAMDEADLGRRYGEVLLALGQARFERQRLTLAEQALLIIAEARSRGPAALSQLLVALSDPDPYVRGMTAMQLERDAPDRCRPVLRQLVDADGVLAVEAWHLLLERDPNFLQEEETRLGILPLARH